MATNQPIREGDSGYKRRGRPDLTHLVLGFVALAAVAGWSASFIGLHNFGTGKMVGYTDTTAWLIPAAFDGAAFACAVLTYRASIAGRSGLRGRVLTWAFTALSSWINYIDQSPTGWGRWVAVWLPIAAVAVFDVVLTEMRADWEEAHGRKAFRMRIWLLLLRSIVDRKDTMEAFRKQIKDIPVSSLVGIGADLMVVDKSAPVELIAVAEVPPPVIEPVPTPDPEPAVVLDPIDVDTPNESGTVLAFTDERPDWLLQGMSAKQGMYAYLDRYPDATGAVLDRFGMRFLNTSKDYGRGVRRDWQKDRQKLAVNEG